jgi:hypothetical protein
MQKLRISIFVLVGCFILSAASNASAQMTGAYGLAEKNDLQIKAAANFAVRAEGKRVRHSVTLLSINKAEQQVVAGMNYKVCMRVRDGRKNRWATAVVYRDLRGKRSLTSWDWGNCDW